MGIRYSLFPLLDGCSRQGALKDPFYVLGSQEIHEPGAKKSVRELFAERYAIKDYTDFDINGKADVNLDLAKPLPAEFENRAGTVLNSGTLEHVLDIRLALENVHRMLSPGGVAVHIVPVSWFNHAFYNLNPCLFTRLAAANDYEILVEGYDSRVGIESRTPRTVVTREGSRVTPLSDEIVRGWKSSALPAMLLYLVALRKKKGGPFVSAYDVTG